LYLLVYSADEAILPEFIDWGRGNLLTNLPHHQGLADRLGIIGKHTKDGDSKAWEVKVREVWQR
jgi:hypothetical protein